MKGKIYFAWEKGKGSRRDPHINRNRNGRVEGYNETYNMLWNAFQYTEVIAIGAREVRRFGIRRTKFPMRWSTLKKFENPFIAFTKGKRVFYLNGVEVFNWWAQGQSQSQYRREMPMRWPD